MVVTQEPIPTEVPLGLDDPAPILVWKINFSGTSRVQACFLSKDGAEKARLLPPGRFKPATGIPIQIALLSVIEHAKFMGAELVKVYDDSLRIIETYSL